MKKIISKLIILIFLVSLSSCTLTISLTKNQTKEKTEKQKKEDKVYIVYYGDRFYGLQTKEIKL